MITFPTDRQLTYADLRDLVFRSRCEMAVYGTIATRVAHIELLDRCKQYKIANGMIALYTKTITVGNNTKTVNSINLELPDIELIDDTELNRLKMLKEPYTRWFLKQIIGNPIDDYRIIKVVREPGCQWVDLVAGFENGVEKLILELWNESGILKGFRGVVQ